MVVIVQLPLLMAMVLQARNIQTSFDSFKFATVPAILAVLGKLRIKFLIVSSIHKVRIVC